METAKICKKIISAVLTLALTASCFTAAFSAFATSVTHSKYDNNFTGSEALSAEINSAKNVLFGNRYKATTNLAELKGGEYTVTANGVTNGELVMNLNPTVDLTTNQLTDGKLLYDSATVRDIRVATTDPEYADFTASNGTVSFLNADNTIRTNVYFDFTFCLTEQFNLTKLIYVNSTGSNSMYAKYYDIYVSDSAATLYNAESLKYQCINDITTANSGLVQNISFDDNVTGKYIGVRLKQGVQNNFSYGATAAFPRVFEIAAIRDDLDYDITYESPTKTNDTLIADKTADEKGITDNLLYKKLGSYAGVQNGAPATITASIANKERVTDGYFNDTATTSCDITGVNFITSYDADTSTYNYVNGYDPVAPHSIDKDNVDTYLTITYKLGSNFDFTDFWMFNEIGTVGSLQHLSTGAYELYSSDTMFDLYSADNKILTYLNSNESYCQKIHFNKTFSG